MVSVDKYHCSFLSLLCFFVFGCSAKEVDDNVSVAVYVGGK